MTAEYLKCPSCGNRVDEERDGIDVVPAMQKRISGAGWDDFARFVHCPHCGTVLGVLPAQK